MYERCTNNAHAIMRAANQIGQEWKHESFGTEHILYAVSQIRCRGRRVLEKSGVDPVTVRQNVESLVHRGNILTMGKLQQSSRAKKVIEYAMEEARCLDRNYVGSEHLLLGLLREEEGTASIILKQLGLTVEIARDLLTSKEGLGSPEPVVKKMTPGTFHVEAGYDGDPQRDLWEAARQLSDKLIVSHIIVVGEPKP